MTSSQNPSASVRAAAEQILKAGGEVSSYNELMRHLEELRGAASAIEHGLRNAAWRGLLAPGAPLDERPAISEIDQKLERLVGTDDGRTPGELAFGKAVRNMITLAQALGDLATTAWTAGLAENTRVRVEEARARYDSDEAEIHKELMECITKVVREAVPADVLPEVAGALSEELKIISQRRRDAATQRLADAGLSDQG
ncbi:MULTISPECIES: hypothetical protein [unclassified Streptomyces]|uniref:hypothetical protein n=1 Tax=unclassified Streptomyces TaxID=2593676 RepID=UPI001BE7FCCC|nr:MULTISPECIES: hypothetical protein [unclassified Streptomyces]MBT2408691.1 hypothetical protein [Streptomyces sp. ISL-21]MBT2613223.1 hypothetical protein [Streptomyces sp. ISL-87]